MLNRVYSHLVAGLSGEQRREFDGTLHSQPGDVDEPAPWLTELMDQADAQAGEVED